MPSPTVKTTPPPLVEVIDSALTLIEAYDRLVQVAAPLLEQTAPEKSETVEFLRQWRGRLEQAVQEAKHV